MNPTGNPIVVRAGALVPARTPQQRLLEAFLSGRSPRTLRAYRRDVEDFARWMKAGSVEDAAGALLAAGQGGANGAALGYRADLLGRGLSPATVNRRLAALRSLLKLGKVLGLIGWTLEVASVKGQSYRDTAGCGRDGFRKLLGQLASRSDAKAVRDRALLLLLFTLGLRRGEAVGLDLADVDLDGATVAILGKGRTQKEKLTLPPATRDALAAWIAVRPAGQEAAPGMGQRLPESPLFVSLDRAHRGHRLTGTAVYQLVRGLGEKAALRARPHGIRHAAVTAALDATNGDLRAVQRFSRHRDVRTVLVYDDCRRDLAGEIAKRLAEMP